MNQNDVNVQAKKTLAKLLARENITVVHAGTRTASFDPKRRILTLPIWKDMTGDLYDLFVLHEVGHALFTPFGSKPIIDACKAIDPKYPEAAKTFLNVVEDARIEKLVKEMYPGSRGCFTRGYKQLVFRNFFNTSGKDLSQLGIIDRINIFFKAGKDLEIQFSEEEIPFIERIEKVMTFSEVVNIAKDLYSYAKKERKRKKEQEQKCNSSEQKGEPKECVSGGKSFEEEDEEDSSEQFVDPDQDTPFDLPPDEEDEEKESEEKKGKTDGKKDTKDSAEKEQKDDNGENKGEKVEEKSGEKSTKKDENKDKKEDFEKGDSEKGEKEEKEEKTKRGSGNSDKESSGDEEDDLPIESETDSFWNKSKHGFVDENASEILYLGIPEPNLNNIIVGYKQVHRELRNFYENYDKGTKKETVKFYTEEFENFKRINKPIVSWLVKEFEMYKAADQYARTTFSKTGNIDLSKLYQYKFSDDIMKRNSIVPGGKNHANLLFLDFSGSMKENLLGSIHQLINLAMFHRRVNTKFRAFTFGASDRFYRPDFYLKKANTKAFSFKANDFGFYDGFLLREIFSSEMTAKEFNDACINLLMLGSFYAHVTSEIFDPADVIPVTDFVGSTPLNETIVAAIPLVKQMYKSGAQFVSVTFVTDGQATTDGHYVVNESGRMKPIKDSNKKRIVFIRDDETKEDYPYSGFIVDTTNTFLKILRNRTGCTAVGFFITKKKDGVENALTFFNKGKPISPSQLRDIKSKLEKDYFVALSGTEYNDFYLIPDGTKLILKRMEDLRSSLPKDNDSLVAEMVDLGVSQRKQRVLLTRYIKLISGNT